MAKQQTRHGFSIGSATVMLIFIIMTLAVFAVLSLVTADNEAESARKTAENNKAYYAAEAQAYKTLAEIKAAVSDLMSEDMVAEAVEPFGAACTQNADGSIITFETEIDEHRRLRSVLRYQDGELIVIGWKTVGEAAEYDDTISIWDGEGLPFET